VVVDEQPHRIDLTGPDASLLARLAQRRFQGALVPVTGSAEHPPAITLVRPERTVLQDDPGVLGIDQHQAGGSEKAPMPVAGRTPGPAVA
jgi:hypothetical protein